MESPKEVLKPNWNGAAQISLVAKPRAKTLSLRFFLQKGHDQTKILTTRQPAWTRSKQNANANANMPRLSMTAPTFASSSWTGTRSLRRRNTATSSPRPWPCAPSSPPSRSPSLRPPTSRPRSPPSKTRRPPPRPWTPPPSPRSCRSWR